MAAKGKILIVDDEKDIRFLMREILEDEGYVVAEAPHSEAAYAEIAAHGMPDLVILDIWLENSDRDGMEILADLKKRSRTLPVLMISGHGNIEMAVKAIKFGAYDFIEKPFNTDRLLHLVTRALEASRMRTISGAHVSITAQTPEMQAVMKAAQKAAAGDARVLVTGPWGTGRTHLARFIHQESGRAGKSCIVVPCASAEASLLKELLAGEGTVILRDAQDLPQPMQTELLARLNAKPEARVIATATPALDSLRAGGRFLPDLYERLSVVTIALPPLECRRGDVCDMCATIISESLTAHGMAGVVKIADDAAALLRGRGWQGQAAELRALCQLAAVRMATEGAYELCARHLGELATAAGAAASHDSGIAAEWLATDLRAAREAFERWYFENLMQRFDGNVSQVAAFAGMDRTALHRKLKALKDGEDAEAAA